MHASFLSPREPGRVLMAADPLEADGAVWAASVAAASALGAYGVHVDLAATSRLPAGARAPLGALGNLTLHEHVSSSDGEAAHRHATSEWLLEVERHVRPDIVHLHQPAFGAAAFAAPTLVMVHDAPLARMTADDAPVSAAWRAGLRAVALVLAPAASLLAEVERRFGAVADGRVVPYGLDATDETPYVPPGPPPVVTLGDPTRQSGFEALRSGLAGAALVLADCPWWREAWGDAAVWTPPCAPEEALRAARELAEDAPRRAWLANRARLRAQACSSRRMAAGLLAAYRELLAGAAAAVHASVRPD